MSIHLDSGNRFYRDGTAATLECPHCGTVAHMSLMGSPDFAALSAARPAETGIVLRCDACNAPVFLRYRVQSYSPERIEFQPWAQEVERPREQFSYDYLPAEVAAAFRDALGCYTYGLLGAFAAMCRLTAQAAFRDLGDAGRLRLYAQLDEVCELAEIDDPTRRLLRRIIFERDDGRMPPELDRSHAAVLLETMKDLLHQAYVRGAKLRKALRLRRHFATSSSSTTASSTTRVG